MLNIYTDEETDRLLSVRAASLLPLPPEISLSGRGDARRIIADRRFRVLMGVEGHPLAGLLESFAVEAAMASEVSRAGYLERLCHYSAWLDSARDGCPSASPSGPLDRPPDRRGRDGGPASDPASRAGTQGGAPFPMPPQAAQTGRAGAWAEAPARRPPYRGRDPVADAGIPGWEEGSA